MPQQGAPRVTMMYPPIEDLLEKVDSKFTLVSLAAKRGRQINSYFSQLGEGLGAIVPPQVASVSRKPLSIALEEIAADKITYARPGDAEEALGTGGHHRDHVGAGVDQPAADLDGLVRSDPPGDPEHYPAAGQRTQSSPIGSVFASA